MSDELIGQLQWLASMGIQTVLEVAPSFGVITPLGINRDKVIPAVAGL